MRHLRVAAAQLAARPPGSAEASLDAIGAAVQEAADRGAEVVVLPETIYPGVARGRADALDALPPTWDAAVARLGEAARAAGIYAVVGMARPGGDSGEPARNLAALFDPAGHLAGSVAKRVLGPLDRGAVRPGEETAPVDTTLGRLGLLVGGDVDPPEVARGLAVGGASVLLVPAARALAGDPEHPDDLDVDVMLPARARENATPLVVANRVGTERSLVRYDGRSAIYDIDGSRLAMASPDRAEVVVADVRVGGMSARRILGADFPLPRVKLGRHRRAVFAAVAAGPDHGSWAQAARTLRAAILVAPRAPAGEPPEPWLARVGDGRALLALPGKAVREIARTATWRTGHRVVEAGMATLGILFAEEVRAPEPARLCMAAGAEVVVLFAERIPSTEAIAWARARAVENRVAAIVASRERGVLIAPDGRILAAGPRRESFVASAWLALGETARKSAVPRTSVRPPAL